MSDIAVNSNGPNPPCLLEYYASIFHPFDGATLTISGEGGSGKTLGSVAGIAYLLAEKLHYYVLTNILFLQRIKGGWRKTVAPHPRIKMVRSMKELWYEYACIIKDHPKAFVVPLLDEWHKYMMRLQWYDEIVLNTMVWWGENRKYQTIPVTITQDIERIPRQLLPFTRTLILKSKELTADLNAASGNDFFYKDLAFVIPVSERLRLGEMEQRDFILADVDQVLSFQPGPLTRPMDDAKVGEVCYDSRGSAFFEMGEVRGSEDWFPSFMKFMSSCSSVEIADKIFEFFESESDEASHLDRIHPADITMHVYKQHRREMPPDSTGYPMVKVGTDRRKRVSIPLNPTNLEAIFKAPHTTLARRMEKER